MCRWVDLRAAVSYPSVEGAFSDDANPVGARHRVTRPSERPLDEVQDWAKVLSRGDSSGSRSRRAC